MLSRQTNHTYAARPTTYGTVTFRSRLEARWAVVFDELGFDWQYEPRPFRTKEGGYLPDFRILGVKPWWIEVKGPEPIERDYVRAAEVVRQTRQKFRFLVGPIPSAPSHGVIVTRILQGKTWRPAEWSVPVGARRLDVALNRAATIDFDLPWSA
jgi:hypothetical protein